jgi:bacterioferritin (cytochrome b1)
MAIESLNMGNLNLEVSSLKNKLAIGKKEKAILQEELEKEKDFQKGCKYNVKILRKNRVEAKLKIKMFNKKLQDENEELKGNTKRLKS